MTFALTCWALCASLTPPCRLFFSLNALKPLSACLGPFMFPFNRGYSPTNTSHVSEMNTSGATWSAELPCHFHEMCSSECLPLRNVEKIDLHQEWIGHCFYPFDDLQQKDDDLFTSYAIKWQSLINSSGSGSGYLFSQFSSLRSVMRPGDASGKNTDLNSEKQPTTIQSQTVNCTTLSMPHLPCHLSLSLSLSPPQAIGLSCRRAIPSFSRAHKHLSVSGTPSDDTDDRPCGACRLLRGGLWVSDAFTFGLACGTEGERVLFWGALWVTANEVER